MKHYHSILYNMMKNIISTNIWYGHISQQAHHLICISLRICLWCKGGKSPKTQPSSGSLFSVVIAH